MFGLILCGVILLTPFYFVYKPPACLISYVQRKWPDVLWRFNTTEKVVALSIDDGPSEFTQEIANIISANNASATFFVIGSNISGHEETLRDLVCRGNELANHALYDEPSRFLTTEELTRQIEAVQTNIEAIYTSAGMPLPPKYFRPGSGFFTTSMRSAVAGLGFKLILGNIFPFDPQIPFWRVNAHHILSMIQPGGIIICHDGRSWTIPMLQKVLPEIASRGYKVVTVTDLIRTKPS